MNSYKDILHKLSVFTTKYYTRLLIKGALLFLLFGVLVFIGIVSLEYFLWLGTTGRLILLLLLIGVVGFTLIRYIITPLFYLFKIKQGISAKEASLLIGRHFPEVGDRLFNLLELAEDGNKSELLLASIEQRSRTLNPIPFANAIQLKDGLRYSKYLIFPLIIVVLLWVSGNLDSFLGSYERVVNYDIAYQPPAPFEFVLLNGNMNALESESYTIKVQTKGEVQPDDVHIVVDGNDMLLQRDADAFTYTFRAPLQSVKFFFRANDVISKTYQLRALKTPAIQQLITILKYPDYVEKSWDTLQGTGNAIIPEGTKVEWNIKGKNTSQLKFKTKDSSYLLTGNNEEFAYSKQIYNDLTYQLSASNNNVMDYETLYYGLKVIKDESPTLEVEEIQDPLSSNLYYSGEGTDDYRISKIELVYYVVNQEDRKKKLILEKPNSSVYQFYYTFPSGLILEKGQEYEYYFLLTDNDAIHGGKTVKSAVFNTLIRTEGQERNRQLEYQQSILDIMDKSLEQFKEQEETLKELNEDQKEKNTLNFDDQNQIKDFLRKQQQQESMMQKFSKDLKESLKNTEEQNKMNELLQERLERQELEAKKNEKLLEELKKVADKIDKKELAEKLEEIGKKQQNSKRNLEQLLELTKRYYVTEKASQLAKDLELLSEEQKNLAEKNPKEVTVNKEQEKLNKAFDTVAKSLDELVKDNTDLKKPLNLDIDQNKKEEIREDQKQALEELNKDQGAEQAGEEGGPSKNENKATQKQQGAAAKMREMSEALQQASSSAGGSSVAEDAEMLRQILDNLITFSFKQETLLDKLKLNGNDVAGYAGSVREQQQLRKLFEHVDDSLFTLSMRQAEITEFVNEQITEVYYNIDRTLKSMAEGQTYQGASYQKYVLTASNNLADFLANLLGNMQQSLSQGAGKGSEGEGFQLPDIIKSQEGIGEKMKGKEGKGGKEKGQEQGEEPGSGGKEGKEGKGGAGEGSEMGKEGKSKSGQNGEQNGQGGQEEDLQELFEIYKEQQQIRSKLEEQLRNMILQEDRDLAKRLVQQMEDFENDLIQNGITRRTIEKVNRIQQQLLKLENAALKQGKLKERESTGNTLEFNNPIMLRPKEGDLYRNNAEILYRQALPLQKIYKDKVQKYFKKDD